MTLTEIDRQITYWARLCIDYPLSDAYKHTLANLQQQRANVANKIGRKNESSNRRKPKY